MARDFVRQVQQLRKDADLEIEDRIRVSYAAENAVVTQAVTEWDEYIRSETLADSITRVDKAPEGVAKVLIGDAEVPIWIEKM
jgi:isoleucyl-tRNA synthetase